eukprot:TRINITY_DN295_c0_g1_i2.p1 TRINITY_DN295_c0_g1~~TRINITY_DN295_c0_g1_i2.p1  ORF type:complete len:145 (+),score=18.04 TRINITY_DN295_c0_g1_i2:54-488(+)
MSTRDDIVATFLEKWKKALHSHDFETISSLMHDDFVFRSPVVHQPFPGKDNVKTQHILRWIVEIVEGFHYVDDFSSAENLSVGMIFAGTVKGLDVQGLDWFRLAPNGKILSLTVMLRPYSATTAVLKEMGSRLEALRAPSKARL